MNSNIFLTGATGLFGSALIEHYLHRESESIIYALVRADSPERAAERLFALLQSSPTWTPLLEREATRRVRVVQGDFTRPDFGLSLEQIATLQKSVTNIIHSGASVDFGLPLEEARLINVQGTQNVINFASGCRSLEAFLHISTGHVAGKRSGTIKEAELNTDQGFFNSYEQTKAESEALVHRYMNNLPITIHRLTTVIGDKKTGHIRQFGFFHNSVRLLAQSILPFLAGEKDCHLDLIPTDYPVHSVYHLHRNNFKPGTTYHICSGPERSFTLEAFLNETVNHFRKDFNTDSIMPPEIISQQEFKQRLSASNNKRLIAIMGALNTFIGHLTLPKIFDASNSERDLAGSGIEPPHVTSYYFKVLDECIRRKFGKVQ